MTDNAPAVQWQIKHSLVWVLFLSAFAIVLIAAYAYISEATGQFGLHFYVGGLLVFALCAALAHLAWVQPLGRLRFDGLEWWWQLAGQDGETLVQPELALDLQSHLLLRCALPRSARPASKPAVRWICIAHSQAPVAWAPLRRALYWRAKAHQNLLQPNP